MKLLKNKELWIVSREMSDDPSKARCDPAHILVAGNTVIQTLDALPIWTRAQRDDAISKLMMARTTFGDHGATQVFGETFMDTQEVNVENPGTTYRGRFQAWIDADFESKWKDSFRRQERMSREQAEMTRLREQQEATIRRAVEDLRNAAPYGKGRKGRLG